MAKVKPIRVRLLFDLSAGMVRSVKSYVTRVRAHKLERLLADVRNEGYTHKRRDGSKVYIPPFKFLYAEIEP